MEVAQGEQNALELILTCTHVQRVLGNKEAQRVTHLKVGVSRLRIKDWLRWAFNSNHQNGTLGSAVFWYFSSPRPHLLIGAWGKQPFKDDWLTVSLQLHFHTLTVFGWRRPAESYQRQLWRHQRSFPLLTVWGEGLLRTDLRQRIHIFFCLLVNLRTVAFFFLTVFFLWNFNFSEYDLNLPTLTCKKPPE